MRLRRTFGMRLAVLMLLASSGMGSPGLAAPPRPRPLPVEPLPATRSMPAELPRDWALVHDVSAGSITDGRVVFVDMGEKPEVRAQIGASYLANYQFVPARHELYVAETFYTRVNRGDRSDVITVYDTRSMNPVGEIALPGAKRAIVVPDSGAFQLLNDNKWGLVYNFTPAAGVTVVDLVGRKVLAEIDIPGCAMLYPMAGRNFGTLCGDGTMLTISLDPDGKPASTKSTAAFNTIDDDPMFMRPAMNGSLAWFATFKGNLRSIDLSGESPVIGQTITLPAQSGGAPEWRPGGVQVIAADANGLVYLLMNPNGSEGSHKDGGTEVWVVNPQDKSIIRRIPLNVRAISIAATREARPKLAVIGIDKALHVLDPATGLELRSIPAVGLTPMSLAVVP